MHQDWKTVQVYTNRTDAEVAGSLLRAHNISYQIRADDAGGAYPYPLSSSAGVMLSVRTAEFEQAVEILQPVSGLSGKAL